VGTLPQELNSSELTGEPVMVQKKKKLSGAQRKHLRKQKKATAAQQAEDRELEAPTVSNHALGLMSIPGQQSHKKTTVTWWYTSGCPEPGEAYAY